MLRLKFNLGPKEKTISDAIDYCDSIRKKINSIIPNYFLLYFVCVLMVSSSVKFLERFSHTTLGQKNVIFEHTTQSILLILSTQIYEVRPLMICKKIEDVFQNQLY